jgi:prevent-host-death family protein
VEQISVRELRQNASVWLRKVQQGEAFEVTDRGRPVAMLGPLPQGSVLDRLIAEGRATAAQGDLLDLWPPIPPKPGVPLPSEILERMRADER